MNEWESMMVGAAGCAPKYSERAIAGLWPSPGAIAGYGTRTNANPQKQPTAAEIIAKCEAMLEPARLTDAEIMQALGQKPAPMQFDVAPQFRPASLMQIMRDAEAQMWAICGLAPAMEKAQCDMHKTGIGWIESQRPAEPATPKFMGINWGADEEPEPKDTPERARERSEGLCGWKGGVRDSDRQGIEAARIDEDWAELSKAYFAPPEAPPAQPSAGLLTIAEPTHKLGGWGV